MLTCIFIGKTILILCEELKMLKKQINYGLKIDKIKNINLIVMHC